MGAYHAGKAAKQLGHREAEDEPVKGEEEAEFVDRSMIRDRFGSERASETRPERRPKPNPIRDGLESALG
jgi:hypothetical protein